MRKIKILSIILILSFIFVQSLSGSGISGGAASGGALIFLSAVTANNSATVDIETTFSSTYSVYMLVCTGITVVDDQIAIRARLKIGGAYVIDATYMYVTDTTASGVYSGVANTVATSLYLGQASDNSAGSSTDLVLFIYNPSSISLMKTITWDGSQLNAGGPALRRANGIGTYQGSFAAMTGIRFYADTGNILAGTFRLYGIKNL